MVFCGHVLPLYGKAPGRAAGSHLTELNIAASSPDKMAAVIATQP